MILGLVKATRAAPQHTEHGNYISTAPNGAGRHKAVALPTVLIVTVRGDCSLSLEVGIGMQGAVIILSFEASIHDTAEGRRWQPVKGLLVRQSVQITQAHIPSNVKPPMLAPRGRMG